jgi:hypothetical protein
MFSNANKENFFDMRGKFILISTVLLLKTAIVLSTDKNGRIIRENAEPNTAKVSVSQLTESDIQKILAALEKEKTKKKPIWSDLDIQLYGYIKLDASYDTSRTTTGNYVAWVDSEKTNDNDNEFNMTANETRLGVRINGPEDLQMKTSGRIEIDFYGSGGDENKAKIQMRHAYLEISWPEDRFSIIAGQTSDVISPLNPVTLNYTVLWDVGNIGYRRPQLRLTKSFPFKDDFDLKLEGALVRTIGDDEISTVAGGKSGEDSGFPTFQGRMSLMFPYFGYKPTTIGFSGHWGQEEYISKDIDTWSLNLDITQPLNKLFTIKGEAFIGENLDTYFGGIGQGVRNLGTSSSPIYDKEIGSVGGWAAVSIGPWDRWSFNVGAGIDDVENGDVKENDRTLNRTVFGNAIYSLNKNIEIGLELSHWRTEYKGHGDADDLRAQSSLIYRF